MIPIQPQDSASGAQAAVQRDIQHYMRPGTLQLGSLPPLSLYVHLPWCIRKCPYCDFNSHEHGRDGPKLPEDRYIDALVADLESALPLIWGRTVHSIFIGGGTPSLFAPESIDRLLAAIRARLRMEADCEITMEANPGTFETDRFRAFRAAGVTRLSIGVQSFDDRLLQAVGRVHDGAQARAAVREAADSFETFNIDLMYALPGQTELDLARDLDVAMSFAPPHLSVYHLTIEPNTYFAKFPPAIPEDDLAYDMLDRITARTAAAGMQRYEISAYAREGHQCWHNRNYWQFGDYLGIGAGAHSKLSFAHRIVRQVRFRDPARYMDQALAGAPLAQDGEVRRADLPFEYMLNALRLREGFALQDFMERTGLPLSSIAKGLDAAQAKGLITRDLGRVVPTERGFDFLSDLQELFLAE
ncbi:oxygen-independent coproporphyrinogen III oxidase-like protein [Delftia sp. SD083]|uniref:radical SAM family heme chaperone HemW n=2 Tax=unclassified Delftia TaxID=2613839 RepID=UPI001A962660|nr:radical SAM family heme chaperone HemW [Delftia sp. SD083]MBO0991356.1 oxygen-independent coproporphyrinogen III oxidase-like protein [Delftia sp. SD083]